MFFRDQVMKVINRLLKSVLKQTGSHCNKDETGHVIIFPVKNEVTVVILWFLV